MAEAQRLEEAWHRQRLLWLVIGIPAATVLGCLLTIYLALSNPDERVSDSTPADVSEIGD